MQEHFKEMLGQVSKAETIISTYLAQDLFYMRLEKSGKSPVSYVNLVILKVIISTSRRTYE